MKRQGPDGLVHTQQPTQGISHAFKVADGLIILLSSILESRPKGSSKRIGVDPTPVRVNHLSTQRSLITFTELKADRLQETESSSTGTTFAQALTFGPGGIWCLHPPHFAGDPHR